MWILPNNDSIRGTTMANVTIKLNDEDISDLMLELATLQKHADELLSNAQALQKYADELYSEKKALLREMGELTNEMREIVRSAEPV